MSAIRSWRNLADGWGTLKPAPDWLEGRVEVTWSTRLMDYRMHFTAADGTPKTAQPGNWIVLDANGGLHVATDEEHGAVMQALIQAAPEAEGVISQDGDSFSAVLFGKEEL